MQEANGHLLLYVDGHPFAALASEVPWWDLRPGDAGQNLGVYDYLYAAAEKMNLNAIKVPVKWAMVEPQEGRYDFSYVDHAKQTAEKYHLKLVLDWFGHYASNDGNIYGDLAGQQYAPLYIIQDEARYPRAVDADGAAHHNAISYEYDPVIKRESLAFRAFMQHIKEIDSSAHTIVMVQFENEISVFGSDRKNPKLWRDHSPVANQTFAEKHYTDDLKYSAWRLSSHWLRPVSDAGSAAYPIPLFHNYVGGTIEDWMVGGAPGEDVATDLENCPNVSFIGVNLYVPEDVSADALRAALSRFKVSRNQPAITETNSGPGLVAPRLAFLALGEFGAPIFAPWALNVSYPADYAPYVLPDGTLANGAFTLRDAYGALSKASEQILWYATTDKLAVFMPKIPGQRWSETRNVSGFALAVSGSGDGQAIVIHPSGHEFLVVGYHAEVDLKDGEFVWPAMQSLHVEDGHFSGGQWIREGEPSSGVNQSTHTLNVSLDTPEAVRIWW
jgi:hypothetical protein